MMVDYTAQITKAIDIARERDDFQQRGLCRFETYNQNRLNNALQSANISFTSSVGGMNSISHLIEDQVAEMSKPFHLYSAFQKISRLWPQETRYRRILATRNPVYTFGLPDAPIWQDPNLHFVPLDAPPPATLPLADPPGELETKDRYQLGHTWFVIVHNPRQASMALVARELPLYSNTERRLLRRRFEGFSTHDIELIEELSALLDQYVKEKEAVGFETSEEAGANLRQHQVEAERPSSSQPKTNRILRKIGTNSNRQN